MKNYYDILGVSSSATRDEIKSAYRKLILLHHPDKKTSIDEETRQFPSNDGFLQRDNGNDNASFSMLQEAWNVLQSTESRTVYDIQLQAHHIRSITAIADEIDIDFMKYDPGGNSKGEGFFWCSCRCGDKYVIREADMDKGNNIAHCLSCSLCVRVHFEIDPHLDGEISDETE